MVSPTALASHFHPAASAGAGGAAKSIRARSRTRRYGIPALYHLRSSEAKLAGFLDHVAVGEQPPAAAQVADHVPVHRGLVGATGLGIGAPDGKVHGAADLLVEE